MQIIIYKENEIVEVNQGVTGVKVKGNSIFWDGGRWLGVNLPFLVLEDGVEVSEINETIIALDQKHLLQEVNLEEENKALKARLDTAETAIIALMDIV
jgi:hypothetical protein